MRNLRRHGLSIVVPCYIELRDWYHRYFSARAYRRAEAGIVESRGEKMGAGQALARLMVWYASLCDGDIEWIQVEGGRLMEAQQALPADYGKVPGRDDPPAIARRTESVFGPAAGSEIVNPGPTTLKPVGLNRHRVEDESLGQDVAVERDDEPAGAG